MNEHGYVYRPSDLATEVLWDDREGRWMPYAIVTGGDLSDYAPREGE